MKAASPVLRLPTLGWIIALGCGALAAPRPLLAQDVAISATIAGRGSDIDEALRGSLNLSAVADRRLTPSRAVELVRADRDRLNSVLRAFGLYEGRVDVLADGQPLFPGGSDSPQAVRLLSRAHVHISFEPVFGPVYRIRSVRIVADPKAGRAALNDDELLKSMRSKLATAEALAQIETMWLARQRESGHVLAAVLERAVRPDAASRGVDVTLTVQEGPPARLGAVQFEGLQRISAQSLEQYVPFSAGDPYRSEQVDRLRTALRALPFFQSVQVSLAKAPDGVGLLPVRVAVVEKPPAARRLMLSGLVGTVALGLTAVMLAVFELAQAANVPSWQRYRRHLGVGIWVLLLTSALIGLQRFLYLADL